MEEFGVVSPPTDYCSWVNYLDLFEISAPDNDFKSILCESSCPEYVVVQNYFNSRIENTVNGVINTCIKELRKNVSKYIENNEISGIHIIFYRFAKKINKCMFFCYIPFLDYKFKNDLYDATKCEITNFWEALLKSVQDDVVKTNNMLLDEELFLIERISLFENVEF